MKLSVFVMLVHTKRCANFGWSGRGTTSRRTVGFRVNPSCRMSLPWCGPLKGIRPSSHLEPQNPNWRLWYPGLSVVQTEANLVASSVVGTAGGGHIVMVQPTNKGQSQLPKSVVVSHRRSHTGGVRTGLRSQMNC